MVLFITVLLHWWSNGSGSCLIWWFVTPHHILSGGGLDSVRPVGLTSHSSGMRLCGILVGGALNGFDRWSSDTYASCCGVFGGGA